MTISKKMWQKPEMIVLVRSNSEEAVLTGCKRTDGGGPAVGEASECDGPTARCSDVQNS